jgi:hypothetical protein
MLPKALLLGIIFFAAFGTSAAETATPLEVIAFDRVGELIYVNVWVAGTGPTVAKSTPPIPIVRSIRRSTDVCTCR